MCPDQCLECLRNDPAVPDPDLGYLTQCRRQDIAVGQVMQAPDTGHGIPLLIRNIGRAAPLEPDRGLALAQNDRQQSPHWPRHQIGP